MKLLAIDTATEACSAALSIDGEINERYEVAPRQHAELILPMVDELLAEADLKIQALDVLAFGRGPGAFTGVRIATGVIQGLAFATGIPVVPVSTLACLAQGAIDKSENIISAIDARMGEIYWGLYKVNAQNLVESVTKEAVSKPDDIKIREDGQWFGVGSGWSSYHEILRAKATTGLLGFDGDRFPRARDIIPLAENEALQGNTVTAGNALPVYLRNKVTG